MSNPELLSNYRERCNRVLTGWLPEAGQSEAPRLNDALRYVLLNGGKRVRAALTYATGQLFDAPNDALDIVAGSIECIHAYSLVHDDLPAMDDDALRRGQPTCHIQFDEATAILVGDALQSLAFEKLSAPLTTLPTNIQCQLIHTLAKAIGANGMAGGQSLDLQNTLQHDEHMLATIHRLKTGCLIQASVRMGALAGGCHDQDVLDQLQCYSEALGLAFQIQDDILDITQDTQTLGKPQGTDIKNETLTYVSQFGLAGAKKQLRDMFETAVSSLSIFTHNVKSLQSLTESIINADSMV